MNGGIKAYVQAASVLPGRLRREALSLSEGQQERAEELRLRTRWPMTALVGEQEVTLGSAPVSPGELEQLLELASRSSVHAVLQQMGRGYLTVAGGHRIGLCGTAVMRDGVVSNLRGISSASVRVARQVMGAAEPVLPQLLGPQGLESTLILGSPGQGKTTLLRDLVRMISEGEGTPPLRVGVVDERGELAALYGGIPQLAVGRRTDVVEGCPKAQGLMLLLRAMNPQVLAVDEITAPEDVAALVSAAGCGVTLLATAHGAGLEDLRRRRLYRELMDAGVFRRIARVFRKDGVRQVEVEAV